MTAETILAELRQGERTTSELMAAAGVSRNAVLCCLSGLAPHGFVIANVAFGPMHQSPGHLFSINPGGHREALWRLIWDPEHPTERFCELPGCSKALSHTNPGPFCRYHKAAIARRYALGLRTLIEVEEVTDYGEQIALV